MLVTWHAMRRTGQSTAVSVIRKCAAFNVLVPRGAKRHWSVGIGALWCARYGEVEGWDYYCVRMTWWRQ